MSKKISMTKLITADFYRRNAETIINSRKSIFKIILSDHVHSVVSDFNSDWKLTLNFD